MRVLETLPLRTGLLAALAGWALLLWVLAVAGLGRSVRVPADDPTLAQALPRLPAPGTERLGAPGQYAQIGDRSLFSENRRYQRFVINPDDDKADPAEQFDYILTSVLIAPTVNMAILQPAGGGDPIRVKLGEAPEPSPSWVLHSVAARSATFLGPGGEKVLPLRIYDGIGGEAPTGASGTGRVPPAAGAAADAGPVVAQPARTAQPVPPPPPVPPAPMGAPAQVTDAPAAPATPSSPTPDAAQAQAIRQRIEARRAQLQQNSEPATPVKKP